MNAVSRTAIILIAALAAGCDRSDDSAVPRRTAYPRIELYADSTVRADSGGLSFDIRAEADTAVLREGWLDISYPRYNATIHMTVRRLATPDELPEAIARREQRISLNSGDRAALVSDFENTAGFRCRTVESLDGGPIPVQFVAYRGDGYLVSGTAVIEGPAEPADSIAPVVRALAADAETLLKSLR